MSAEKQTSAKQVNDSDVVRIVGSLREAYGEAICQALYELRGEWPSRSAIYQRLHRLERQGILRSRIVRGGPNRRVYRRAEEHCT